MSWHKTSTPAYRGSNRPPAQSAPVLRDLLFSLIRTPTPLYRIVPQQLEPPDKQAKKAARAAQS